MLIIIVKWPQLVVFDKNIYQAFIDNYIFSMFTFHMSILSCLHFSAQQHNETFDWLKYCFKLYNLY